MSLPKYLRNNNSESSKRKRKSKKQEKRLAKEGFLTPGSGNVWCFKGDVEFDEVLVEAKRTDKKQMAVKEKWLKKIFDEAITKGKEAGIELEFKDYYIQGFVFRKRKKK